VGLLGRSSPLACRPVPPSDSRQAGWLLRDAARRACPLPPTRALKLDREMGGISAVGVASGDPFFRGPGVALAAARLAGHSPRAFLPPSFSSH
jgi:hypothetical protein